MEADSEVHESHSTSKCHCNYPAAQFVGDSLALEQRRTPAPGHHSDHNEVNESPCSSTSHTKAM
jgi:hypothetical protein